MLGNVLADHEKAKDRLKDKHNRKMMDKDLEMPHGTFPHLCCSACRIQHGFIDCDRATVKIKNIISRMDLDVFKVSWLIKCINENRIVEKIMVYS